MKQVPTGYDHKRHEVFLSIKFTYNHMQDAEALQTTISTS